MRNKRNKLCKQTPQRTNFDAVMMSVFVKGKKALFATHEWHTTVTSKKQFYQFNRIQVLKFRIQHSRNISPLKSTSTYKRTKQDNYYWTAYDFCYKQKSNIYILHTHTRLMTNISTNFCNNCEIICTRKGKISLRLINK